MVVMRCRTCRLQRLDASIIKVAVQIKVSRYTYNGCLNVGSGGESASVGSHHFMYVVQNCIEPKDPDR